jgi:hypothetical protein
MSNVVHLADLIGLEVDYEPSGGDRHHGTIAKATYSLYGELVLIVAPAHRPCETPANAVLIGPVATAAIAHASGRRPRGT